MNETDTISPGSEGSRDAACSADMEEHMDDNYAICPYCRYQNHVEAEDYDSSEREEQCAECHAVFIQFEDFTVTHYTRPCPPNAPVSAAVSGATKEQKTHE